MNRLQTIARELGSVLRELNQARREAVNHAPRPPAEGLVLEVGAGQSPHPRVDVVVDKYVADNFERPAEAGLDVSKPLVVADGERIPFADGSFAYTIALHVLEHATDPAAFAAELSRASTAGFVQVPSRESELTFGWPYHPWLIDREGDTLVFTPREAKRAPLGDLFHGSYAESTLLRLWWASHRSTWHHSVHWRGQLDVKVRGESAAEKTAVLDVDRTIEILSLLDERGALRPLSSGLGSLLRCPACRARLEAAPGTLSCIDCDRSYPVVGGVPVLLEEAVGARS
jgi:uncharacterized protein YbaR (Trm112 family)